MGVRRSVHSRVVQWGRLEKFPRREGLLFWVRRTVGGTGGGTGLLDPRTERRVGVEGEVSRVGVVNEFRRVRPGRRPRRCGRKDLREPRGRPKGPGTRSLS